MLQSLIVLRPTRAGPFRAAILALAGEPKNVSQLLCAVPSNQRAFWTTNCLDDAYKPLIHRANFLRCAVLTDWYASCCYVKRETC